MPKICFRNSNQTFDAPQGTTILACAIEHDVNLDHDCGGNCACTTCQVIIEAGAENLAPMDDDERSVLEANDKFSEKSRLGCQARVKSGEVAVRIPE